MALFPPLPDRDDVLTVTAPRNRFEKPIKQWFQAVVDGFRNLQPRVDALETQDTSILATLTGYATSFTTAALVAVTGAITTLVVTTLTVATATVSTLLDLSAALIVFPAGSWTPSLKFGGTSTGMTYTTQLGIYVKIGRLVVAQYRIVLSATGSSTGTATIEGLPFIADATGTLASGGLSFYNGMTGLTGALTAAMLTTSPPTLTIAQSVAAGHAGAAETVFTNTSQLIGTAVYLTPVGT